VSRRIPMAEAMAEVVEALLRAAIRIEATLPTSCENTKSQRDCHSQKQMARDQSIDAELNSYISGLDHDAVL